MSHVVLASSPLVGPEAMTGLAESLVGAGFEVAVPAAAVFLDARLPDDGVAPDQDAAFAELLDALPSDDGLLPAWPDWWPPEVMAALLPDVRVRDALRSTCPRLHRSMFSRPVPAPDYSGPCGFVGFGDGCADAAAEARRRGWPTTVIGRAHHLWPVVEPETSASTLAETIGRLHR